MKAATRVVTEKKQSRLSAQNDYQQFCLRTFQSSRWTYFKRRRSGNSPIFFYPLNGCFHWWVEQQHTKIQGVVVLSVSWKKKLLIMNIGFFFFSKKKTELGGEHCLLLSHSEFPFHSIRRLSVCSAFSCGGCNSQILLWLQKVLINLRKIALAAYNLFSACS